MSFFLIVVLVWGTLEYLQSFLQCIKYIILGFTPSTALCHPPPLTPGTLSTGIIFAFTHMCIHYLYCIDPLTFLSPPAPQKNLFHPPVIQFYRRKSIKDNKRNMALLLIWEIPCVVFMHICITTPTGSSVPVLFTPA
jgi:hypothetical protein